MLRSLGPGSRASLENRRAFSKQRQLGTVGHADGDRQWRWGEMHPGKRGSWEKEGMAHITWTHACFQKNSHCHSYSSRHLFTQMFITYTYMHREHPHKGKNGYTVVQFPYRVTHASRTMKKKKYIHRNGTKVVSAHLRLIFVCVSLSLSVFFSLSIVLFPPLSLYIFPLSPPRSTLFLCSCTVWWEDGRSFWKAVPFAPSGRPAREDGCRLRLINM